MKARRHKKRKASPKQLAALAKGRAARKAKLKAPSRRKARKARKASKSLLSREGRHRPVVIVRKRKLRRPRRSTIPSRAAFKNPFLGELAMIGNPRRKHRKARKSHRRSHRRSSRRSLFANPGGKALSAVMAGPKEMLSFEYAKDAAAAAAGFVLPNMIVAKLPANLRDSRAKVYASKFAVVAGLSAASSLISKRAAKMILLGGGVSLLLDAWVDFAAPMIGGAAPASSTGVWYGDEGTGVYYGDAAGSLAESFG